MSEQPTDNQKSPTIQGTPLDDKKMDLAVAVLETTTSVMNPVEYEQMRKIAREYYAAGALPASYENAEQVFLAMQFGRTMGMTPHESVVNGYFISGAYNVYGKAIPAALRRHGWTWKFVNETPEQCCIVLTHSKTGETIEDEFLYQDAVDSGFTQKWSKQQGKMVESLGWKKGANRKRKLRYGVLSLVLHTYLPDVLGAVSGIAEYTEDYVAGEETLSPDEAANIRKQRMEAAAAERSKMREDGFTASVVQPFHNDDGSQVSPEESSSPSADDQSSATETYAEVGYQDVKRQVNEETGEIIEIHCEWEECQNVQKADLAKKSREKFGIVLCAKHWSMANKGEIDPNAIDPAQVEMGLATQTDEGAPF